MLKHPFFEELDWSAVRHHRMPPPWVPRPANMAEMERLTTKVEEAVGKPLAAKDDKLFEGF